MLRRRLAVLAAAISLFGVRVSLACPLCGENMSNDVYGRSPTQLGRGFFWSIILMVSMEFTIVALFVIRLYIAHRRAKEAAATRLITDSTPELV